MRSETRADSRLFGDLLRSLVKEGIAVRFRARGNSMYPAIVDGDLVQVEALADPAKAGDVVLAENAGVLLAHRVVCNGDALRTQGDCCLQHDETARLLGKVLLVNGNKSRPVPAQRLGSLLRRWFARWRGRF